MKLYTKKPNFKEFIRYGKTRIFVFLYSAGLGIFFVDWLGSPYWVFILWFAPLNFIINYFLYKFVYHKKQKCLKR